jgi:hypothetical protein
MIKHWIMMVMALMIALQSVAAIADAHQSHQSGTLHLEFNQPYQSADTDNEIQLTEQAPDKPGQSLYDCPHCCHCHGHGFMALVGSSSPLAIFSGVVLGDYRATLTSVIPASLFRPPIA